MAFSYTFSKLSFDVGTAAMESWGLSVEFTDTSSFC